VSRIFRSSRRSIRAFGADCLAANRHRLRRPCAAQLGALRSSAGEYGAIGECAHGPNGRQTQHSNHEDNTVPPTGTGETFVVSFADLGCVEVSIVALIGYGEEGAGRLGKKGLSIISAGRSRLETENGWGRPGAIWGASSCWRSRDARAADVCNAATADVGSGRMGGGIERAAAFGPSAPSCMAIARNSLRAIAAIEGVPTPIAVARPTPIAEQWSAFSPNIQQNSQPLASAGMPP
jgi:hypothetical protein